MAITVNVLGSNSARIDYDAGTALADLIVQVGYYIAQHGWSPTYGTATGGSATSLIDTTKNFGTLGVTSAQTGMYVSRIADGKVAKVYSITTTTNPNDTLNYQLSGITTGGSATSLIDTTHNFVTDGVAVGHIIKRTADGKTATVATITTTTNQYDTLNFTSSGSTPTFGVGDAYTVTLSTDPPTFGASDVYDVIWDGEAGTNRRAYRALNKDGSSYKYIMLDWNSSGYVMVNVCEYWWNRTHFAGNLCVSSNTAVYSQQIDLTNGGSLFVYSYSSWLILFSQIGATYGCPAGFSWCGCLETTRDNPEDILSSFNFSGTATSGTSTTLRDDSKNFISLGVYVGQTVTRTADGKSSTVIAISSAAPGSNNVITYLSGAGAPTFGVGDAYTVAYQSYPCWGWANGYALVAAASNTPFSYPRLRDGSANSTNTLVSTPFGVTGYLGITGNPLTGITNSPTVPNLWNNKNWAMTMRVAKMTSTVSLYQGKIFGLKLTQRGLQGSGDDFYCPVDADYFYDPTGGSTQHWILAEEYSGCRFIIPA